MSTSWYLASRMSRREELIEHAELLHRVLSDTVTSRWLWGDEGCNAASAARDAEDVLRADGLILFSEQPGCPTSNGRMVEMGLAIAWGKRVIVCTGGHEPENIFHHLPIERVPDFPGVLALLLRERSRKISLRDVWGGPTIGVRHG